MPHTLHVHVKSCLTGQWLLLLWHVQNAHLGQEMNDMYKMLTKYRVFKSIAQGAATGVLAATCKDVLGGE